MAPREHAALNIEISITGGVPTEQPAAGHGHQADQPHGHLPGLVTVIHRHPVTISQPQVTSLVPDDSITVTVALVIHSHPVGTILTISNDTLGIDISINITARFSVPRDYCRINSSPF